MFTVAINPEIFHILGPFAVHIYGLFVALGSIAFIGLTLNHPLRKKNIERVLYEKTLVYTIIVALSGARILHIISEWDSYHTLFEMLSFWNGGLSILGAVIAGLIFLPIFLWYHTVPILPVLDLAALYLPLTQAIARLGCLFAGCCFGAATRSSWAVVYTHMHAHAPRNIPLVPTQVYSSLIFLAIFVVLQIAWHRLRLRPGTVAALYLILSSSERFFIDFYRGDRISLVHHTVFNAGEWSFHQYIALALMLVGILTICNVSAYDFNKRG